MNQLSKKQQELLVFTASTWMGLIRVDSRHETNNVAEQLVRKNLMERRDTKMPFCDGDSYWSLTTKGWDVAYSLK
jgi:hypothetical protein